MGGLIASRQETRLDHSQNQELNRVNFEIVNEWKEGTLEKILEKYSPGEIFNADETGMFYEILPSRTFNKIGS